MEASVNDRPAVEVILAQCEQYWRQTGVADDAVVDMRRELASHLSEAMDAGKSPTSVVGDDVASFAEAWAAEQRGPVSIPPPTSADTPQEARNPRGGLLALGVLLVAVVAALVAVGPKETNVDDIEMWRWVWLGSTVVLGIGEMVTAGLFMLPFAIGAAVACILAFFDIAVWVQLLAFLVVSVAALWGLRRFASRENEPTHAVGARRYVDAVATVVEPVERLTGAGRVRLETELWRATTDLDTVIPAGSEVRVVDVRGARLVVEPR